MANQSLIHDASVVMAQALLDQMTPFLRYEERLEAIGKFYCICKAGVEAYEIQSNRMRRRLKPLEN